MSALSYVCAGMLCGGFVLIVLGVLLAPMALGGRDDKRSGRDNL